MKPVSVLIPLKGRHVHLEQLFDELAATLNSEFVTLLMFVDHDDKINGMVESLIREYGHRFHLIEMYYNNSAERFYSVKGFNYLFNRVRTNRFIWLTNTVSLKYNWLNNVVARFETVFPDEVGVLSFGGKINKANIGMSSMKFTIYNRGWFHGGYVMNYCDDELACRAILLGRYAVLWNSGAAINVDIINSELLYDSQEKKTLMKKKDRSLFYKRSATNFGLPKNKAHLWTGFREVNYPIIKE
jgi:hypothetical protein